VGCSTGYLFDLLCKERIKFHSYSGLDANWDAIEIAAKRHNQWEEFVDEDGCIDADGPTNTPALSFYRGPRGDIEAGHQLFQAAVPLRRFDVVIDGACIMHVEDWKEHARMLGLLARRELIFSRLPMGDEIRRQDTYGHGRQFSAWQFKVSDLATEMGAMTIDGEQVCC